MQKLLLGLALVMSATAFAGSKNGMTESDFVSVDQITKYQDLPQTIVLRVRKLGNSFIDAARTQRKLTHNSEMHDLHFEELAPNYISEAIPVVEEAQLNDGQTLVSDRTSAIEPYYLGFNASSRTLKALQMHRSSNLGYPFIRYYKYTYTYLPYDSLEDAQYIYVFYSWTNYYQ